MDKVYLYDTTLRDGAQAEGISFSLRDKLAIVQKLDEFGIDYIEGGFPGSNPKDIEFFLKMKDIKLKKSKLASFGSTKRSKVKPDEDLVLGALIKSETPVCTIFGKTWDLHVRDVLKVELSENLDIIFDTVKYLKSKSKEVVYDAEHFFDGYKANSEYALKTLKAAVSAGADSIVLCDTNGGSLPFEVEELVKIVKAKFPSLSVGVHMHNDGELAVANSIVGVKAGATQVQGTINGFGERCGNANLISIISNLKLKMGVNCVSDTNLKELTEISHYVSEVSNMVPRDNQPFVGLSAFAHKAGVHVDAMIKNPSTYEHVDPSKIGNKRRFIASELSGKTAILVKAKEFGIKLDKDSQQIKGMLGALQKLEHSGYHYETAEGSLELFMKRFLGEIKSFFELESFRVIIEKRQGEDLRSEATVELAVNGISEHTASKGDGPVNALDNSLRKALKKFYPSLQDMHLSDFKVRVIDGGGGTASKVRVTIQSYDQDQSWGTIGVSENIIEASWFALVDSVQYKLMKDLKRK